MRISRVRSDSGWRPGRNLDAYRVLLDGVPQTGWVTADEERGMVERDVPVDDPGYTSGATEVLRGQVRLLPSEGSEGKFNGTKIEGVWINELERWP